MFIYNTPESECSLQHSAVILRLVKGIMFHVKKCCRSSMESNHGAFLFANSFDHQSSKGCWCVYSVFVGGMWLILDCSLVMFKLVMFTVTKYLVSSCHMSDFVE